MIERTSQRGKPILDYTIPELRLAISYLKHRTVGLYSDDAYAIGIIIEAAERLLVLEDKLVTQLVASSNTEIDKGILLLIAPRKPGETEEEWGKRGFKITNFKER